MPVVRVTVRIMLVEVTVVGVVAVKLETLVLVV